MFLLDKVKQYHSSLYIKLIKNNNFVLVVK